MKNKAADVKTTGRANHVRANAQPTGAGVDKRTGNQWKRAGKQFGNQGP